MAAVGLILLKLIHSCLAAFAGQFQESTVSVEAKIRFGQRLRQLVQKRPASQILVFVTSSTHTNHLTEYFMTAGSNAANYHSMKISADIDPFPDVEKLAMLTQLYLELSLPLYAALRAAEADL